MILRKSVFLSVALLLLAILVLPPGTSSASISTPRSSEATPSLPADPNALRSDIPTDQIIVKYKIPASMGGTMIPASAMEMQRLSDAAGVPMTYVREMSGDAYVLGLPSHMPLGEVQAIADRMTALPEVEYAEPDAIMQHTLTPNDPRYTDQWHYFAPGSGNYGINAPAAWDITTGSSSVVVAVIDTGITNHIDLAGRTVPGYDFITNVTSANDGDGRDSNPSDPGDWRATSDCYPGSPAKDSSSWHGTHTAGTIGAASNNGVGVAGVNWASKILPVRVLGKCGGDISDVVDAMRWSVGLDVPGVPANANPAKVLNLSLGGSGACETTFQNAINDILAAGATIAVSAGNSNNDAGLYSPASCNGVITVAATNRNGSKASYSNYGATVEISAPGGDTSVPSNGVLSTLNAGTQGPVADTYAYYQGTSMAAPHVAGVASLLYSINPSLTPARVLSILQSTATSFPGGSTCTISICGSGIVNAGAAVAAVSNPVPTITGLNPPSATPGGPAFTLTVNGTGFINSSAVRWNGSNRTTTYVSGTQLTAAITAADIATDGKADVTVFNPTPGGGASNAMSFVVGNPVPTIIGLDPSSAIPGGPAFTLTVNGAAFMNSSVVRWNGSNRTTTYVSSTQLIAAITTADIATEGKAHVTVFNPAPGGGASNAMSFVVGTLKMVYLPLAAKNYPPIPDVPVLNTIANADGDGNYTVSWNASARATGYLLQEDDNAAFSSPETRYSGSGTSWSATGKAAGTYYYRVQASNTWGTSGWSNPQTATVGGTTSDVVNGNFETGATGWAQFSTHGWTLIRTTFPGSVTAHSGSWAVWLGGDYDEVSYVRQQVTVPPSRPFLAYWHWISSKDACGQDFGGVMINNSTVVDIYNLCSTTNTGGWVKHVINLSAYAGQSVSLQIRASTNGSLNSNLFVDDVAFQSSASSLAAGTVPDYDPVTGSTKAELPGMSRDTAVPSALERMFGQAPAEWGEGSCPQE